MKTDQEDKQSSSAMDNEPPPSPPLMLMIEGAREFSTESGGYGSSLGGDASTRPHHSHHEGGLGHPKHPLRIDLRHNEPDKAAGLVEETLESTYW